MTSLKNVKTKPGAEADTDHVLLVGRIRWKLRRIDKKDLYQVRWNVEDLRVTTYRRNMRRLSPIVSGY